jgi:hypothetical protein
LKTTHAKWTEDNRLFSGQELDIYSRKDVLDDLKKSQGGLIENLLPNLSIQQLDELKEELNTRNKNVFNSSYATLDGLLSANRAKLREQEVKQLISTQSNSKADELAYREGFKPVASQSRNENTNQSKLAEFVTDLKSSANLAQASLSVTNDASLLKEYEKELKRRDSNELANTTSSTAPAAAAILSGLNMPNDVKQVPTQQKSNQAFTKLNIAEQDFTSETKITSPNRETNESEYDADLNLKK